MGVKGTLFKRLLDNQDGSLVVEYVLFCSLVLLLFLAVFTAVFWKGIGY
jgi:Flp pilus assembly pilin Flp